ncbi:MAG: hypothetical protein N2746_06870 [Deltaproteobacteria bacterium]|nr:hypothetical protein [Deltaproteobacteria bacterium]
MPKKVKLKRMKGELKDYLEWLIYANCSRYNGDINLRVLESRRRIEANFKNMVFGFIDRINAAIEYSERMIGESEEKVDEEIKTLLALKDEITYIRNELSLDPKS